LSDGLKDKEKLKTFLEKAACGRPSF